MRIPVSEAKAQLTDLVRRAEAGEDVILTRHGQPAVRLTPVHGTVQPSERRLLIGRLQRQAAEKLRPGPAAARSQDELYGPDGLPG